MKSKKDIYAHVDERGRIVLPPEVASRYGLKPGEKVLITEMDGRISMRQSVNHLTKLYIEPTNKCNLSCRTCIRHCWGEHPGEMGSSTFKSIVDGILEFPDIQKVMLGGFGEPLMHFDIAEMAACIKKKVSVVELITNGVLLTEDITKSLLKAGLDVLWISLDGSTSEKYDDIRQGARLAEVVKNVERARNIFLPGMRHIGIVFVAMRRNVKELPDIIRLGRRLGADRFMVTNVVPYTEEMCEEALYSDVQHVRNIINPSALAPHVSFPKMDICDITSGPLTSVIRGWRITNVALDNPGNYSDYCPFIEKGTAAISWDGAVSPCLPLMHSHTTFLNDHQRFLRSCAFGSLKDKSLADIWQRADYAAFRERVQVFDFSPCTQCGGCHLSRENEEDCFGNGFPTCGGCLWAQGIIQCP